MWALPGLFRCSKCGKLQGIWRRAIRSPFRTRIGVCRECLSLWERTGHRCGQCWSPIQAKWDLGLLLDREVFAHVDCGGALLLPLGWSGRFILPTSIPIGDAIGPGASSKGRRAGEAAAGEPAAPIISPEG
jgi:hypothetical protein